MLPQLLESSVDSPKETGVPALASACDYLAGRRMGLIDEMQSKRSRRLRSFDKQSPGFQRCPAFNQGMMPGANGSGGLDKPAPASKHGGDIRFIRDPPSSCAFAL